MLQSCPRCGTAHIKRDGRYFLRSGKYRQQYKCLDCGYHWRKALSKEDFGTVTAKLLLIDIETAPMHGRFWSLGKQHVGIDQITKDWFILGWSAKWLYSSEVFSEFVTPEESLKRDDYRVLKSLWSLINDATIIIGHNVKNFDIPKITTRFIYHRILPPSPFQIIDTYLTVKNLAFSSNKLQYINHYLGLKEKLKTDYQLWIDCEEGNQEQLNYMQKYCKGDCIALEDAFIEIRPYTHNGVNLALHNHSGVKCCSVCGSPDLSENGYYHTSVSRFISYQCNNCGSYSRERVSDVSLKDKKNLLAPTAR